MNRKENNTTLKKSLGLWEAIALVVGMVIGSGIFFKPAIVFQNAGSSTMGILAWVVSGVITIASGLTIAEIASAIPITGGLVVYLKKLYGERWAFLLGWVQTLIYVPGSTAASAVVFATQATYFFPMTEFQQKLLAIFMILVVLILNSISIEIGGKVQSVATVGKLIPIVLLILIGLIKGKNPAFSSESLPSQNLNFGVAMLGTLWAYDGWVNAANIAGELKNSKRDLPIAIIVGLIIIMSVYVLVNIALVKTIPFERIIASEKPVSEAAVVLLGSKGSSLIAAGILISIFGALNGYLMTGARVPFAMGRDGLLPFSNRFSRTNRAQSPYFSLIFEAILASIYAISGSFNALTDLVVFVLWIFFVMAIVGVFILRRRKDLEAAYKVPLYPIVPLIGIIGGLYIIVSTIASNARNSIIGIVITVLGLPVYYFINRKRVEH